MDSKEAERKATELLRQAGYTWAGRKSTTVSKEQSGFERRQLRCPFGGYSRRKRG